MINLDGTYDSEEDDIEIASDAVNMNSESSEDNDIDDEEVEVANEAL